MKMYESAKKCIEGFFVNILIILAFWGGLLRRSFNADTITFMVSDHIVETNLKSGRYMQSLFDYLYGLLGFKTTTFLPIATLGAFCFFALSLTVLQTIFSKWKKQGLYENITYFTGISLVFLNVLYSELLMFGECCIHFGFGYFCASMGAYFYTKKKWFSAALFLLIAACTYQYTVVFVAIILAFYLCFEAEFDISWILVRKEIIAISFSMLFGLVNLISIKVLVLLGIVSNFSKSVAIDSFALKFSQVGKTIISFFKDSYGLLPSLWIPLLFMLFIVGVLVWSLMRTKYADKLIAFAILLIGSILLLYILPIMSAGELYFPARMAFCTYLIIGLVLLVSYWYSEGERLKLISLASIGFIMIQLLFAHFIIGDRMVSNNLDKVYIDQVNALIEKYETESGVLVENICVIHDIDAPFYYVKNASYYSNQINERVIAIVPNPMLRAMTGRVLTNVPMDQSIYEKYFEGRNWDTFIADEQVVFDGNTIYWCVF